MMKLGSRIYKELPCSPPMKANNNDHSEISSKYALASEKNFITTTGNLMQTLEDNKSSDTALNNNIKDMLVQKEDVDNVPFDVAVIRDRRKVIVHFWEVLKDKEPFLRSIFTQSKTELISVNISVYIFSLNLDFTLNAAFYTDDVMSKRYNGELNFISNILRSVYSCLVGTIILYVINAFSTYYPLLDTIIVEGKNYERSFILVRHFLRILKLKLSFLFTIEICCTILFWFYTSSFCAVYPNSQIEWFKGGWSSFAISLITSFSISIGLCLLRVLALTSKSKGIYNTVLFIKDKI